MAIKKSTLFAFAAVFALGGCSMASDVGDFLWPSLSGDEPSSPEIVEAPPPNQDGSQPPVFQQQPPAAIQYPRNMPPGGAFPPPPPLGTTNFQPPPVSSASPTGTFVGQKVVQLRNDLGGMQGAISAHNGELQNIRRQAAQNAQTYHGIVAAINARLQSGTTPGNPILVRQWNDAQTQLERLNADVAAMNSLSNKVAADSGMAAYLLESTRAAYGLAGAIEEDHRQLAILEDEVNRTVVLIDRLLNELSEDVRRQTDYLHRERENLTALSVAIKNGELYGTSLANRAYVGGGGSTALLDPAGSLGSSGSAMAPARRPLVIIRFDRENVDYQQALYTAVSRALERRAGASFDVVAVTPAAGSAAKSALDSSSARRNAERVLRSLVDMGLPADRVALSAMSSPNSDGNEVHVYVR